MVRNEPIIRGTILVFIALLLICCAGMALIRFRRKTPAVARPNPPRLTVCWEAPANQARSLSLSRSGLHISTLSAGGAITCYAASGKKLYSARVPGANQTVVAPDGSYTLAYSRLDPRRGELTFLDSAGRKHWTLPVSGAVWSADSCVTPRETVFAVGTGDGFIYVVELRKKRSTFRRWRVQGAVVSLELDPSGRGVLYGTWQRSSIVRADLRGRAKWKRDADPTCLQFVEPVARGKRILVRSMPVRSSADGDFRLLDSRGGPVFSGSIDRALSTRVLCSPSGRYVCLGYREKIEHKGKSVWEERASLLDASGRRLWDKGSLFFRAKPLAITSDGFVLVNTDGRKLFTVSPQGRMAPAAVLEAEVRNSVASRDGSRIVLQCADDKIHMLRVTQ